MEKKMYYIISLKHTSKGDTALTFWGENGSGYTYHRDRAGLYNEDVVDSYCSDDNVKVDAEIVDKYWMNAQDFNDLFIAVPNNRTILQLFELNDKFMKPKRNSNCRMIFLNTPVTTP